MRARLLALAVNTIAFFAFISDATWFVLWPLIALGILLLIPVIIGAIMGIYYRLWVPEPQPGEIDSMEAAKTWLQIHGFLIEHECDEAGGHVVGVRPTVLPGCQAVMEIWVAEERQRDD